MKLFERYEDLRGTTYIEIQKCKLLEDYKLKKIVKIEKIKHWEKDSLYIGIDNIKVFDDLYIDIIGFGIHNNLEEGYYDYAGITYYSPNKINSIIQRLLEYKPEEYEILLEWLNECKNYNGFYILGF